MTFTLALVYLLILKYIINFCLVFKQTDVHSYNRSFKVPVLIQQMQFVATSNTTILPNLNFLSKYCSATFLVIQTSLCSKCSILQIVHLNRKLPMQQAKKMMTGFKYVGTHTTMHQLNHLIQAKFGRF